MIIAEALTFTGAKEYCENKHFGELVMMDDPATNTDFLQFLLAADPNGSQGTLCQLYCVRETNHPALHKWHNYWQN